MSSDSDPLARIRSIPDPVERARRAGSAAQKAADLSHAAAAIRAVAVAEMADLLDMSAQQIATTLGISRARAAQLTREGRVRRAEQ